MAETAAEEIARLQLEIAQRQSRLNFLVLGDPRVGVTVPIVDKMLWVNPAPDASPPHHPTGVCGNFTISR